jgi:hypothetical protein
MGMGQQQPGMGQMGQPDPRQPRVLQPGMPSAPGPYMPSPSFPGMVNEGPFQTVSGPKTGPMQQPPQAGMVNPRTAMQFKKGGSVKKADHMKAQAKARAPANRGQSNMAMLAKALKGK